MKKTVVIMVLLAAAAGFGQAQGSDDIETLKKEIANQQDAILKMQLKLEQMDAAKSSVTAAKAAGLTFSGDFRYRNESIDDNATPQRQDRNRIRVRVGMNAKINDETSFMIRLGSGSDDPISANQTLDGGFSSKAIWLDQAYLTWKPAWLPGASALAGKMGMPFVRVGGNQLIWDGDLNPEGLAATYDLELAEGLKMFASGGGFWADQRIGSGKDATGNASAALWGLQGGLTYTVETVTLTGGASYYDFSHVEGAGPLYGGKFYGNSATTDNTFANDYNIVELFGEAGTNVAGMPVGCYGNYVVNTAADTEDTGYVTGLTINKLKDPGSWQLGYAYQDLEDDAVVGAFTDSDFLGGGTNGSGHLFGAQYQVAKNVSTAFTYFRDKKGEAESDYDRYQFDVMLKF